MSADGSRRLAAIDIGTVTTRLLIADVTRDSVSEVFRSTDITHLGEGLTETGRLDQTAMARVAAVIERYVEITHAQGVESPVAVTTSAARDADNSGEFLDILESRGMRPLIISGDREAALSFTGATSGGSGQGVLVVDIGGGSTELVLGDMDDAGPRVRFARSVDVGSRRIMEMFLFSDPPTSAELDAASGFVREEVGAYFAAAPSEPSEMVSVAGTATTMAAIDMQMIEYDARRIQGATLDRERLAALLGMLAALPLAERERVPGLHPGRAPVIVAGALILESILDTSGLSRTTVSDRDILYGILLDTYAGLA